MHGTGVKMGRYMLLHFRGTKFLRQVDISTRQHAVTSQKIDKFLIMLMGTPNLAR